MKHRLFLTVLAVIAATFITQAQTPAAKAFADAPQSVFPLLDQSTRLDMIDYFNAGMSTQSANNLGGTSAILAIDPMSVKVKMTDASTGQLFLLPAAAGDTIVGVIRTVATPGHDSGLTLYTSAWKPVQPGKLFTAPVLKDWVTDVSHMADVEMVVPFMLTGYEYDPATSALTLTNNLESFLSKDIYEMVAPYMAGKLVYVWNGKRFTPQR